MLPILTMLGDGHPQRVRDIMQTLADQFRLSPEDLEERVPNGSQTRFYNRTNWALTYMAKAGLVTRVPRAHARITDEGLNLVASHPTEVSVRTLRRYETFRQFEERKRPGPAGGAAERLAPTATEREVATPDELMESAYRSIREDLADELLERVRACPPSFFEQLVVDVLVSMGYGGSLEDAGAAIGRTGDGGIDGTIKEDRLGLDVVCIQAKRWEGTVGRPVVQAFVGSMEGRQATKGVLITTSSFSRDAEEYVNRIQRRIVLVDGRRLAELMIDHDVGVATKRTYAVKRVDSDYFPEDS